jgi:hypothetical protein
MSSSFYDKSEKKRLAHESKQRVKKKKAAKANAKKMAKKTVKKKTVFASPLDKKLLGRLASKVGQTSNNQVRKELGLGSHNTIIRWFKVGHIPTAMVKRVSKYVGVPHGK